MLPWKMVRVAMVVVGAFGFNGLSQATTPDSPDRYDYVYLSRLPLAEADAKKRGAPGKDLDFFCAEQETGPQSFQRVAVPKDPTQEPPQFANCRNRLLDGKGATVTVVYVALVAGATCPADIKVTLAPDEQSRKTAAAEGVQAILKFVKQKQADDQPPAAAGAPKAALPTQVYCYWQASTVLHQLRARLALNVTLPWVAPAAAASASASAQAAPPKANDAVKDDTPPPPTPADGQPETASIALVTGPAEHVFFSGDAVVRGAKELKYDPATKGIFERDKPDQLYLGLNLMLGDVYGHYDAWSPQRLVAKALITPSKHPFDSVGLGVGYRFKDLSDILDSSGATSGPQASGGFMLFVGHFWTKGDSVDNDGGASNGKRAQSWRVGLSYSLDTLFGWLQ